MTQISKITTRRRRRRRCRLKRCCRLFLRCLHQILELGPFWAWPGGQAKPGVRFATLVPTSNTFKGFDISLDIPNVFLVI